MAESFSKDLVFKSTAQHWPTWFKIYMTLGLPNIKQPHAFSEAIIWKISQDKRKGIKWSFKIFCVIQTMAISGSCLGKVFWKLMDAADIHTDLCIL